MTGRKFHSLWASSALMAAGGLIGLSGPAHAQAPPSVQDERTDVVIVTAERREVSVLDTPVAVTALTGELREKLAITNQQDLALFTPSFSFSDSPNRVSIRGFGRLNNTPGK